MTSILPLINHGHLDYGENKVQEAIDKWQSIKFDFIHSLDNLRLAEKISSEQIKQNEKVKLFIQINIGEEEQTSGVSISNIEDFYKNCVHDLGLDIVGFMCLPPNNSDVSSYFLKMQNLIINFQAKELSMGMSSDYVEALKFNSSYLRIGSKIFGQRT